MTEPGLGELDPKVMRPEQVPPDPATILKDGGAVLRAVDVAPDDIVADTTVDSDDGEGMWDGDDEEGIRRWLEGPDSDPEDDRRVDQTTGLRDFEDDADRDAWQKWFDALPEARRQELLETREYNDMVLETHNRSDAVVLNGLEQSAPELLEGRLPDDLAERMGDVPYILGVRQHGDHDDTAEGAAVMIAEDGGLDLANQSLAQSMLFTNQHRKENGIINHNVIVKGYYGSNVGRFVIVLPVPEGIELAHADAEMSLAYTDPLKAPSDFYVADASAHGRTVVNPKYLAGFIDDGGVFHKNTGFMIDGAPFEVRQPQPAASEQSEWL